MAFSSSLTLTLLSMFLLLTTVERKYSQVLLQSLLLLLGFAGAILSKGPAGGVIPIAIGGLFYIPELVRNPKRAIFRLFSLVPSLAIGGLLAACWYFEAYKIGGQRFLDVQLLKENVSRLTGDGKFEVGHEKPFFFGPIELIVAFLPWSLAVPLVIRDAYRNRGYKSGSLERFSLVVVIFFLIICSLATSKRPVYFLPVIPFLALLTAISLKRWEKISRKISIIILVGYSLAAVLIVPYFQNKIGTKAFSESLNHYLEKGEPINQVANEFYPTLFYLDKGMKKVDSLGQVQSGKLAIIKESDQNPELADLVLLSPGKVDDGKGKLALVRRK
jgi:4-amino-4-deoxy-L-arabinose transferase-like glycosyltransferase